LTVTNQTGFDFNAVSVDGTAMTSSATANGASSTLDLPGTSDAVAVTASDGEGRNWSGGSVSCPADGNASVTLLTTNRTLASDRCTVDLVNATGFQVDWELYVSSIDEDDYDEAMGIDLADGASVVVESAFAGYIEVFAWNWDEDAREWEDELASCPQGQLVTVTLDASHETETFDCGDGTSVPAYWQCDGEEDCENGADELDCPSCSLNVTNNTSEELWLLEAPGAYAEDLSLAPGSSYLLASVLATGEDYEADLYAESASGNWYWAFYSCLVNESVEIELTDDNLEED